MSFNAVGAEEEDQGEKLILNNAEDENGNFIGMNPVHSPKKYPRVDSMYKNRSSLDFDQIKSKCFEDREKSLKQTLVLTGAMALCGCIVGAIAATVKCLEYWFIQAKIGYADEIMDEDVEQRIGLGYFYYMCIALTFALIAGIFCVYVSPASQGSGIPEMQGTLNGVSIPELFTFDTFASKIIGLLCGQVAGLAIGQEEPFAHIGAVVGTFVIELPIPGFKFLQNDSTRRRLVAAGFAAGVSCAFGAPTGATLMVFELSQPNSFWRFEGMWQTFLCASFALFTFSFIKDTYDEIGSNNHTNWDMRAALFFMGDTFDLDISINQVFMGICLGVICGPLGALLLTVSTYLQMLRQTYCKQNWQKLLDIMLLALFTCSCWFFAPYFVNSECVPKQDIMGEISNITRRFNCPEDYYSPLATMLLNPQAAAARTLTEGAYPDQSQKTDDVTIQLTLGHTLAFFALWYFFAMISNETYLPSGFFVPGMLCGAAIGSIYNEVRIGALGWTGNEESQSPIFIGCGAMLASYTPLTYSLAVMIMETTNSFQIIIPLLVAMQISRNISKLIVDYSIYDRGLRLKNIPLLRQRMPLCSQKLHAQDLMTREVLTVPTLADMESVKKALNSPYNAFPVLNTAGRMVGLVGRTVLLKLVEGKIFYDQSLMTVPGESRREIDMARMGENTSTNIQGDEDDMNRDPLEAIRKVTEEDKKAMTRFTSEYDAILGGFPDSKPENCLGWEDLIHKFGLQDSDVKAKEYLEDMADQYHDQIFDLRPYMTHHPQSCYEQDKFERILVLFRTLSLRHMPVINPGSGYCVGMITRQDLFKYMSL